MNCLPKLETRLGRTPCATIYKDPVFFKGRAAHVLAPLAVGNVKQQSVEEIIRHFDAGTHPILSTLIRQGPLVFADEASELGYAIKKDYADKCHLCQEARAVLLAKYPEHLAPDVHYVERDRSL